MEESFSFVARSNRTGTRKSGKARSNTIANPIFLELQKYVEDPFWIAEFEDFSNDKFPRGFGVYGNNLNFKKGTNKNYQLSLEGEPEELAEAVINFFHEHGCRYSPSEKEEFQVQKPVTERKWKNMKAFEKREAILKYVNTLAQEWQLTNIQKENLQELISEGLDDGSIKSNRIVLENCVIKEIKNVDYIPKKKEFDIKFTSKRKNKTTTAPKTDPILKNWADALLKYNKKFHHATMCREE